MTVERAPCRRAAAALWRVPPHGAAAGKFAACASAKTRVASSPRGGGVADGAVRRRRRGGVRCGALLLRADAVQALWLCLNSFG